MTDRRPPPSATDPTSVPPAAAPDVPWRPDRLDVEQVLPATDAQLEVWLADRLGTGASLAFNEAVVLRLHGGLDVDAMQVALDRLVHRHALLRATVGPDGGELVVRRTARLPLATHDLRGQPEALRAAALAEAQRRAVTTPFDLARGPLVRAECLRTDDDTAHLLLTAHHLVCDGASWAVVVRDLGALWAEACGVAPSPSPSTAWSDYLRHLADTAAAPTTAADEAWWLGVYEGRPVPVLDLPTDRPRPTGRDTAAARRDHVLAPALVESLRRTAAARGTSLFGGLLAAFGTMLWRLTGQDDLVVGVPAAGQALAGMDGLVGHAVHLLPLRLAVDGDAAAGDHLARTGTAVLDAFDHASLTYGTLLRRLQVPRDPSRLPLVSVMFNLDGGTDLRRAFPGLDVEMAAVPRAHENFELFVNAVPGPHGLRLEAQYRTALFDAETVDRWLAMLETIAAGLASQPERALADLPVAGPEALARLHALQPPPVAVPPGERMHTAFERQARATPARPALRVGGQRLTYAELDWRSARLAARLRDLGAGPGDRIGLCLPRSLDLVVGLLGILRAGAAYVPLDPDFPTARLALCAEDADIALLLTRADVATAPTGWRPDAASRRVDLDRDPPPAEPPLAAAGAGRPPAAPGADDPAYVIHTSGSTGRPKGVVVPHGAVGNFLAAMRREPGLGPQDRLAAVTTLSFDIAVLELLLPLSVGAEAVIVPRATAMDGRELAALLADTGCTTMQGTPGLWRLLLDAGWRPPTGFAALVGGEPVPVDLARTLLDAGAVVWNLYGPTETTVWSTAWRVDPAVLAGRGMAIGRPVANTQVWVLDARGRPLPVGVPGELAIGGAGVALGYHGRPDLTADRFVPDTLSGRPGARLYRTGDRGRWRNDGLLEHQGRLDQQLKVRGHRIEPGEIEAACRARPGIADAVVTAREDRPGDVRLVAYVVPAPGGVVDPAALSQALGEVLPPYMRPQHWVTLAALPRLPNGKVDRRALPPPAARREDLPAAPVARPPRDDRERAVLAAMEQVLSLPGLHVDDDFFALGGHSLLAARLVARLEAVFELRLPLRTVFEARTAAGLARAIGAAAEAGAPASARAAIPADPTRRIAPLTPQQARVLQMEALHPGQALYNTPSAHRLRGPLDRAALHGALQDLVRRQPALRTWFGPSDDGRETVQHIAQRVDLLLPVTDLRAVPADRREATLMQRLQVAVDTPIDITRAPLVHAALYVLDDDDHVLFFMPHHLVWDGASFDVFYEEMAAAYGERSGAGPSRLPAPAVSPADWAAWLADWLRADEAVAERTWWKRRFAALGPLRPPRTDRPRRAGASGTGATDWVRLDAERTEALRAVARRHDATLNMLMLAVFADVVAARDGHPRLLVGLPVRGRTRPGLEGVAGFFNNLLPLPVELPAAGRLTTLVAGVKAGLLDVLAHEELPFERLATEPEVLARMQGAGGLYHALFSWQDARERPRRWGPLQQENLLLSPRASTQDLGLWLMEVPQGLEGGLTYNADLFDAATIAGLKARILRRIDRLLAEPDPELADWRRGDAAVSIDAAGPVARPGAGPAAPGAPPLRPAGGMPVLADPVALPPSPEPGPAPVAPEAAGLAAAAADSGGPARPHATPARPGPAANGTLAELAALWSSLLGVPAAQIRPQDNFFDLGGQSLLAVGAASAIEQRYGLRFDARRLVFESLGQIAAQLDAVKADGPSAQPDQARAMAGNPAADAGDTPGSRPGRPASASASASAPMSASAPASRGLLARLFGRGGRAG